MCMEDVRLGRQTGPQAKQFAPTAAANMVIADQDPHRTTLIIGMIGAVAAIIAPFPLDPSANEGHHLGQGEGLIFLDIQQHGNIVTQQWRAAGSGGTSNVTVWECTLNKE